MCFHKLWYHNKLIPRKVHSSQSCCQQGKSLNMPNNCTFVTSLEFPQDLLIPTDWNLVLPRERLGPAQSFAGQHRFASGPGWADWKSWPEVLYVYINHDLVDCQLLIRVWKVLFGSIMLNVTYGLIFKTLNSGWSLFLENNQPTIICTSRGTHWILKCWRMKCHFAVTPQSG